MTLRRCIVLELGDKLLDPGDFIRRIKREKDCFRVL
jgi:hypothetical protein